jgi:hypothetical protein
MRLNIELFHKIHNEELYEHDNDERVNGFDRSLSATWAPVLRCLDSARLPRSK